MNRGAAKLYVARSADALGITTLGMALQRLYRPTYIRVVNYHDVAPTMRAAFAEQLAFYRRHFTPARKEDLLELLNNGRWPHRRPGLVLTFDDGLRSHYEVVAPALEEFGFQGWFFVPVGLLLLDPRAQPLAARRQLVEYSPLDQADPRVFMTIEQLRDLNRRHIVGCHTVNHVRLADCLSATELDEEILESKRMLEAALQQPVTAFAWVGGEEWAYSTGAAQKIARAYDLAFTTNTCATSPHTPRLQIDRTNVEAHLPLPAIKLQLSGIMDLYYVRKRRRVARLISQASTPAAVGASA